MSIRSASAASALWRIAIPSIVVNAGSGGALLSITLLKPTVLTLYGGHAFVLHDPLGLMGDRLLAHVHRAIAERPAPPAAACRWVTARGPLAAVWDAADAMAARGMWRVPRRHWPDRLSREAERAPRVAESRVAESRVAEARLAEPVTPPPASHAQLGPAPSPYGDQPRVLLLSESERADSLAPHAAARLLLRAIRHDWAIFAVTRQGPARHHADHATPALVGDVPVHDGDAARAASGPSNRAPRPWCTHLVCRAGMLEPLPVRSPVPPTVRVRTVHHD